MEIQFILLGSLLSLFLSFVSPKIEKHFKLVASQAKVLSLVVLSIILALINYFAGEGFWSALGGIIGSASGFYAIIQKLVFDGEDPVEKFATGIYKRFEE